MTDGHDGGKHGISWSGGGEPTPPTETQPLGPPQVQLEQIGKTCARCFHQIEAFVQMCPAGGICVAAPTETQTNYTGTACNLFISGDPFPQFCKKCGIVESAHRVSPEKLAIIIRDWFLNSDCHYSGWGEFEADIDGTFKFDELAEAILKKVSVAAPTERVETSPFSVMWDKFMAGNDLTEWGRREIAEYFFESGQAAVVPSPAGEKSGK